MIAPSEPDPSIVAPPARPTRLLSLDILRGITIAAMILANNPGSWTHVYPPLRHAEWHGWTATDLIFPTFLLMVGVAIPYSLGSARARGVGLGGMLWRIARRSVVIFGIGFLLAYSSKWDLTTVRIPGVLQRIAVCYLLASLIDLVVGVRGKVIVAIALVVGYWLAMAYLPALTGGTHNDFSRPGNLAAKVDRALLPGHLYKADYDPEGIFSTIPALATTLIGVLAGHWLRSGRPGFEINSGLFLAGFLAWLGGWAWSGFFPINKALWSSSFVLLAGGLGLQALAALQWLVDFKGWKRGMGPFLVLGRNAIAAYVVAALLYRAITSKFGSGESGWTLRSLADRAIAAIHLGPANASLAYAVGYLLLCSIPVYLLHRKGWYLRA